MIESVPSSDLKKLDEHWIDLLSGEDAFLSEMTHARCKQFDGGKVEKTNRAWEKYRRLSEEEKRYFVNNNTLSLELMNRTIEALKEIGRWNKKLKPYERCKYLSKLDVLHDIQY